MTTDRRGLPSPLAVSLADGLTPAVRGRVWIVDDSRLDRERSRQALAGSFDVETFEEGGAMLEKLATDSPDVLLLDWQLPELSGIELCRFVRERFDEVTLPILLLSVKSALADFGEGLAAGANDYVAKPFDELTLIARVRTLVRIQRQAEETRERELWLHTTLSSIGEGVIATDAAGHVLFMNPVAEALTGVVQKDALRRPFAEVCVLAEEGVARATVIVRGDGQKVAIEHTASPIAFRTNIGGVVHVLRDARAARARADFEEKLVAIVSHDLRNPLQAILLGTAAILTDEQVDKPTNTMVTGIRRSALRATKLISDVLDFTQARLGDGIPIRLRPVDLHTLASQVIDDVMAAHPGRQVIFEASGDGGGDFDPERLAQVLANLLSNSVQYGTKNEPITVRSDGDGDSVTVAVHNKGPPIRAELAPVLFEPMQRGIDPHDNASRSVGLGLYIVKHIVDGHGGVITVHSTLGEGTTFSVKLPRNRRRVDHGPPR